MIIMPVPKDVRVFKPKVAGPLDKRQTKAVGAAIVFAFVLYNLLRGFISGTPLIYIVAIIDIPILLCGFMDVYGMPLLTYVKNVAITKLLAPKYRPYKTENTFSDYAIQNKITYEYFDGNTEEYTQKALKKKKKENEKRLEQFYNEHPDLRPIL